MGVLLAVYVIVLAVCLALFVVAACRAMWLMHLHTEFDRRAHRLRMSLYDCKAPEDFARHREQVDELAAWARDVGLM